MKKHGGVSHMKRRRKQSSKRVRPSSSHVDNGKGGNNDQSGKQRSPKKQKIDHLLVELRVAEKELKWAKEGLLAAKKKYKEAKEAYRDGSPIHTMESLIGDLMCAPLHKDFVALCGREGNEINVHCSRDKDSGDTYLRISLLGDEISILAFTYEDGDPDCGTYFGPTLTIGSSEYFSKKYNIWEFAGNEICKNPPWKNPSFWIKEKAFWCEEKGLNNETKKSLWRRVKANASVAYSDPSIYRELHALGMSPILPVTALLCYTVADISHEGVLDFIKSRGK